jgi:GH25 family lysozyme M1 (1,4-beta-N-acetylmuramidase)
MHQEEIDWQAVKAQGIDFAYIRCGYRGYMYGDVWEDPYFHQNMLGAIDNDIEIGVYFFSQAMTVEEAREEADFVIRILRGYTIDLPVVFDMEDSVDGHPSRITESNRFDRTVAAVTFLHHMQNAGYDVMVYNSSLLFDTIFMAEYLQEFDIWVADYNYMPQYPYQFRIWQYTSEGSVDGIEGGTDMDIMFVPKEH